MSAGGDRLYGVETGVLRVIGERGDALVLDAATGERETVRIESTVDGLTETLVQPWSLWRDRVDFDEAFLGEGQGPFQGRISCVSLYPMPTE